MPERLKARSSVQLPVLSESKDECIMGSAVSMDGRVLRDQMWSLWKELVWDTCPWMWEWAGPGGLRWTEAEHVSLTSRNCKSGGWWYFLQGLSEEPMKGPPNLLAYLLVTKFLRQGLFQLIGKTICFALNHLRLTAVTETLLTPCFINLEYIHVNFSHIGTLSYMTPL